MIFLEEKRIRATVEWIRACFLHFSFKKNAVPGLRIETQTRTEVRIRASALVPVPYLRCGTLQQRTTDPASASGTAFRTARYASAFEFCFWRIKIKLVCGRIRVQYSDPDLPGLIRLIRASRRNDTRCPRWRGQS